MSRLARVFRSRITLALIGVALVGGGGAYWAVASSASNVRQAGNSLANTDPTSTPSAEDPTATTDPGATATATMTPRTPTPRATATPCPATGQLVHWLGRVVSRGTTTFVLAVGCARPTIAANGATSWPGQAKQISDLHSGWIATVDATRQPDATYLASSVNAIPPINN
jgi:hypothetical protein